jgi:TolB protein
VEPGGRLATLNADGGAVVRYDAVGVVDVQFPAWSPDGSRVAAPGRAADGTTSLFVFDATGEPGAGQTAPPGAINGPTGTAVYTSEIRPPFYLSWSPDGRRIAFLTSEPTGIALRVVPADGGGETLVREGNPMYWDWVDASHLLVHAGGSLPGAFVGEVAIGAEGEAPAGVAPAGITPGFFRPPLVSRDGQLRAYVAAGDGDDRGASIVVERFDGSERRVTPAVGSIAMNFDPAGRTLAYTASGQADREPPDLPIGPLRLIDAETGVARPLLDEPVIAFFWSPDGRTIAALRLRAEGEPGVDIASAAALAAPGPIAIREAGVAFRVFFVDVASGEIRGERDLAISELYAFQVVPFFDQYALSHRTWAPDGSAITLPLVDAAGRSRVMVVPADGSEPRFVADGIIGFWRP